MLSSTGFLIGLNLLGFAWELSQGPSLDTALLRWGLVPADVTAALQGQPGASSALITVLTSAFLHASWVHLLVNMVYLWVFGRGVEDVLGHGRFLLLYVGSVVIGGLAQVAGQPLAVQPSVGASAGIAGTIAATFVLAPGATLGSLSPVLFFEPVENLSALLLLLLWLVAQFFSGVASISAVSGVAWWAHVGGFAAGLLLALTLRPRGQRRRRWKRGAIPRR